MPNWERLWDDFVQEELRFGSGSTSQQRGGNDEGDLALLGKRQEEDQEGSQGWGQAAAEGR
jgi:hypothetical protein